MIVTSPIARRSRPQHRAALRRPPRRRVRRPGARRCLRGYPVGVETVPLTSSQWVQPDDAERTADDVSMTFDGRRLDSRETVLAFLAEVEAEREAGCSVVAER